MDTKERVAAAYERVEPELIDISRWMYENPEVAFEEYESSARLAAFLRDRGFAVEHPAHGLDTAFRATVGSAGPEVVICAEYDALPGISQACGHNIIATAALGAASSLVELAGELGVRVTVLGTPAEEKYGGKVDLIRAGAFDGAAASMMIHPSPKNTVDPRVLAITHVDVEFFGKNAHASAAPWEGLNALDAFVAAYVNISAWRQAMMSTDRVHGIITDGGKAANIIPDYTRSEWFIRAATKERLDVMVERFTDQIEAAARASGCRVVITPQGNAYSDMRHEPTMVELFDANSTALGRTLDRSAPGDPAGSTDMGDVSHVVPSIHPMLAIETNAAVNHQAEFAAATITDSGNRAIRDGALAMAWTIIDLAERDLWDQLEGPVG